MLQLALVSAFTVAVVLGTKDPRCFPPMNVFLDPSCIQDTTSHNPNFDCRGGFFVQSSGIFMGCESDRDCANNGEPNEWCNSDQKGYQWTIAGCHCDPKLKACTVQRFDKRINEVEWAYCTPQQRFKCDQDDYCSRPIP
ncbi:unnamed protein product [Caenorhabditis sp. 36 PRJEB53466]|nr:unnamed protein product [Caenorhabditis sp. 36 PRJEB53466]